MKKIVVLLFLCPLISIAQRTAKENNQKIQNLDEVKFGFAESNDSPYSSMFEGFWYSEGTTFNVLITHKSNNDLLTINSFSFTDNTLVEESIVSISENEINTIAISEDDWRLSIKYSMIDDNSMRADLTGSATVTLIYKKVMFDSPDSTE
ncbi:hypothetical protein N9I41_01940 [Flavobacteriaceae bacterium]|nr:hypothetical protein [Flavobacteriaceae bacterium]